MTVEKKLLTVNPFSRPGKPLIGVRGIVVHWVGNANSTAIANRNYFESLKNQNITGEKIRYASAHYIIGLQGEVYQCIPEDEIAYHAGGEIYNPDIGLRLSSYPNNCTIGIELCHPEDPAIQTKPVLWIGKFNAETLTSCRELIQDIFKRYGLFPENVWRHYDITGKNCPRYFVLNEDKWKEFRLSLRSKE
jgi:N-acetylmuramoyl-L-alanine amidase